MLDCFDSQRKWLTLLSYAQQILIVLYVVFLAQKLQQTSLSLACMYSSVYTTTTNQHPEIKLHLTAFLLLFAR